MPHRFPDPRQATSDGIVAVGGKLTPEYLIEAYEKGIFPWPISGHVLPWFCPEARGILEFDQLHISRTLRRAQKRSQFVFSFDQSFLEVIENCAHTPRPQQKGTWITDEIKKGYFHLHKVGLAHSVEVWSPEIGTTLVGGLYGVDAGGAFAAESMFYKQPYASKLAILYLIDHLKSRGLSWIDIQVMTPHMEAFGARMIPRDVFLNKLKHTQNLGLKLF